MRYYLGVALVSVLLVAADHRPNALGEVKLEIPTDSKWRLVRGWKGTQSLKEVIFCVMTTGEVSYYWSLEQNDEHRIGLRRIEDFKISLVGNCLRVIWEEREPFGKRRPLDEMHVILKRKQ